ncbi:DUF885 domain-containing protein [Thermoactinospora rubra]|uniref:DUF885 domain-containing protein n=1 Tax=Thermoactinospora rubra TaxID=1088767 RepID=UPI000A103B8F|nr:DUF885 domain-containing protein [Thermoactinospora rubra]
MTPIFQLCDEYVFKAAQLDPVDAVYNGIKGDFGVATDYSPDGHAAREALIRDTLSRLAALDPTCEADRQAAAHLRERLEAMAAWHETGEPYRDLSAPFGLVSGVRDSIDLLPHGDDEQWRKVAAHLAAVPGMLAGWRRSLEEGLRRGLPAARRQALGAAEQAERYVGTHDDLVASYGDGPVAGELAEAAGAAHAGYAEIARYLREEYAPRAAERDAVGPERYAVAARLSLGDDIDLREAYAWGWAELDRIQAEMEREAEAVLPGATVDEAIAHLDETQVVTGPDAFHAWLKEQHERAIEELDGVVFDIPEPLRKIDVVLNPGSTSGAPYYTPPSEDLSRPGRTWWPLGGRERFTVWNELTTVFHEGVPGHHLQLGAAVVAGEKLSRYSRLSFVSGHGEGWALYAERLADELGWFTAPGTRLGMLAASALRAARVVIDIGVHLELPLPDGSAWTFEKACEVLRHRGRGEPHVIEPEVLRYFGWPAQAISYKLGERAWLEARAEASAKPGFDLKRWHTAALALGPIGLGGLREALARLS